MSDEFVNCWIDRHKDCFRKRDDEDLDRDHIRDRDGYFSKRLKRMTPAETNVETKSQPVLPGTQAEGKREINIPTQKEMDQLQAAVAEDKAKRKATRYSNYMAQLGKTGSFHWPDRRMVPTVEGLHDEPNYYQTTKTFDSAPAIYDCLYKLQFPDNPYKYMYNLHREDRRHAGGKDLHIHDEEMSRPKPGILVNSDYGRRISHPSLHHNISDERHHHVAWHRSFTRERSDDASK